MPDTQIIIDKYIASRKLKIVSWILTIMGLLLFCYPVAFILSLIPSLKEYNILTAVSYLEKIYFINLPSLAVFPLSSDINSYILFSVAYASFAILLIILANFLLERNELSLAFSFIIFLGLSLSEYLINPNLNFFNFDYYTLLYLIFGLLPFLLLVVEIFVKKDFKKEQFYVRIIYSLLVLALMFFFFKGINWLLQNRQLLKDLLL